MATPLSPVDPLNQSSGVKKAAALAVSQDQRHPLIYCSGCNECFLHSADELRCPRCGAVSPGHDTTASQQPTLLWRSHPKHISQQDLVHCDEDRRMLDMIGREIGVYTCEALLGRGGMGWVFLARHGELQRACALKLLSPRLLAKDQEYLERFQNEGRAAAALVHPNIVTVHAIGTCGESHFIEMEFVPGRSLQQRLQSAPIPPLRAVALASQIAAGLAAAHRAGVLHRDLKPDNILLTHRGVPKIGDFGLAKRVAARATGTEKLAGTPNFMAPELFEGEPASPASDVYALGVCLFLMLTGRLPFARPRLRQLIAAVRTEPLPSVREFNPNVSLEICESVSLMLAKSPANRPRDGIEASQLLQAVMGQARDLETLLHEALDDQSFVQRERENGRHRLTVTLPDGRRQKVFIEESAHGAAERLLLIYSVCCPAEPGFFPEALRLNAEVSHGAIAVRDINGQPHFVMINTYPRGSVDADEIRCSVLEVAVRADAIEHRLTGADIH